MADFNININAQVVETNNIAGEALTKGDLVYLASDGKYYKATASLNSKATTELKIALSNASIDVPISMLVYGYFDYESAILTAGNKHYVSTISGGVTDQLYLGTFNIIRYVGTAYNTQILLFNPDQTYISEDATKINDVPLNFGHVHDESDITDLDKYTVAEVDALIASATDINYVHVQGAASVSWVIAHSLGKNPSVTVIDGSGNNVFGEIVYTDVNNLTVNFNTAFAGTAYLN
tara:strand:+ start:342 stop:1046 length:705 start_codon:yes stop_codon:yes gene_type:complete